MRQTSLVDLGTGHNPTKNHLLLVIRARPAAKNFQIESPRPLLICSLIIFLVLLIKTLFSLLRITNPHSAWVKIHKMGTEQGKTCTSTYNSRLVKDIFIFEYCSPITSVWNRFQPARLQ